MNLKLKQQSPQDQSDCAGALCWRRLRAKHDYGNCPASSVAGIEDAAQGLASAYKGNH